MTITRALGLAAVVVAMNIPAAALSNLTGNYLLTAVHVKPSAYQGSELCVTINEDGSVLGWGNSGTFTIEGEPGSGQFFIDGRQLLAWIVGSSGTASFTAHLPGTNTITDAAFSATDSSGNAYVAGAYTAQKNAC